MLQGLLPALIDVIRSDAGTPQAGWKKRGGLYAGSVRFVCLG